MNRFLNYHIFATSSLAVILLLWLSISATAQDINHFQIEKVQGSGLFNNHIVCFNQDKLGFIWVGTSDGLYRYDGYNFKAFRNFPSDPATLLNNRVSGIIPIHNDLWVATWGGLSRLDAWSQTVTNFPSPGSSPIYSLVQKNDSTIWVGAHSGLYEFDIKNHSWKRLELIKNSAIFAICHDKSKLYLGARGGGYIIYDLLTGISKYYNPLLPGFPNTHKNYPLGVECFMKGAQGNLWISSWGNGLVRLDPRSGQLTRCFDHTLNQHVRLDSLTAGIVQDGYGNIWVADRQAGLVVFDPTKNRLADYPVQRRSESELSGAPRSIFRDRSGIIWIGTEDGVFKYDPH